MKELRSQRRSIGQQFGSEFKRQPCTNKFIAWAEIGGPKMEEGVTIAKVPPWMELKPEMMPHLIREHEKLGRTLTEEETVSLLRTLGFEINDTPGES
jgi:hypothetical protein